VVGGGLLLICKKTDQECKWVRVEKKVGVGGEKEMKQKKGCKVGH